VSFQWYVNVPVCVWRVRGGGVVCGGVRVWCECEMCVCVCCARGAGALVAANGRAALCARCVIAAS